MLPGQTKTEILILHLYQNANQLLVVLVGLLLKNIELLLKSVELLLKSTDIERL